jgi:hypothetical protein
MNLIKVYISDDFELVLKPESLVLSAIFLLPFFSKLKDLEVTGTLHSQKVWVCWAKLQVKRLLGA